MRYADAFRFPFANPRWVPNVLLLAVSNLVPLIGGVFALGYTARVLESVRAGVPGGSYHDFDLQQATDYLVRGLRVLLVSLLLALAAVPLYLLIMFVFVFAPQIGGVLISGASDSAVAGLAGSALSCAGMVAGVALLLALMFGAMLVSVPLHLRAALHPDLGAALSWRFVSDFLRRCWKPALLAYLVFVLAGIPILFGGMLLLVVGMFPATAYLQLVHAHLLAQLADLHEARGGEPVVGPRTTPPAAR
ncbi:MAG TPA: DUF4013 domain-containing protein [Thermoanaerobaculia bacterium]|nr:DUF4013 domain-containing protein [Thermoanaerobaculia bacterium]